MAAPRNAEIAAALEEIADYLEVKGENPFRVRAYRTAAQTVLEARRALAPLAAEPEKLGEMPGIGPAISAKIATLVQTGAIPFLEDLRRELPIDLRSLLRLRGLGAKKIKALYTELGIADLDQLRAACEANKVCDLRGFGDKTEQAILAEIDRVRGQDGEKSRLLRIEAERQAGPLVEHVGAVPGVAAVVVAGSFRRKVETIGDIDVLATSEKAGPVIQAFAAYEGAERVLSKGPRKSSILLHTGLQADLRVFPAAQAGAALHYFTGSKPHNIAVRAIAVKKGLKINEYGVFKGERRVGGRDEREVFAAAGLPYIEPELRENRGEIEAGREGRLPRLVEAKDIRGDLHVHTRDSDGRDTIEEMARAAKALGYAYMAVSDHSQRLTMVRGLTPERLAAQVREIDRVNGRVGGIRVLKSSEVDILDDGALDLPDGILDELDFAIGSIHSKFRLSRDSQTERLLRAMDHPKIRVIGHPTGRILNKRPPYDVDMERLCAAARERNVALELNAYPDRLDLNDVHARMAKEAGVIVAVSTDAHNSEGLEYMRFGVDQARRGWLEAKDVLNTRDLEGLTAWLRAE